MTNIECRIRNPAHIAKPLLVGHWVKWYANFQIRTHGDVRWNSVGKQPARYEDVIKQRERGVLPFRERLFMDGTCSPNSRQVCWCFSLTPMFNHYMPACGIANRKDKLCNHGCYLLGVYLRSSSSHFWTWVVQMSNICNGDWSLRWSYNAFFQGILGHRCRLKQLLADSAAD